MGNFHDLKLHLRTERPLQTVCGSRSVCWQESDTIRTIYRDILRYYRHVIYRELQENTQCCYMVNIRLLTLGHFE